MMMTCEQLVNDFLGDYFAGRLSFAKRAEFKVHLMMCPNCRRYVESYRKTVGMVEELRGAKEAEVEEVPEELVDRILKLKEGGEGK